MSCYGCFVVLYQFKQQNLPACKPVLSPAWVSDSTSIILFPIYYLLCYLMIVISFLQVITTFLLMGVIFIPIGLVTLRTSHGVNPLSTSS